MTKNITCIDNSMKPFIYKGETVLFKKYSFRHLQVNDIVVIKNENNTFIRRVIYKTKSYLITKGDNNVTNDEKSYQKNILGKVYQIKRGEALFNPEYMYLIQSTIYYEEIVKLIKIFSKKNINYVFLKGLILHLYYFKSYPRRLYADCDILIDEAYKEIVHKIFAAMGYRLLHTNEYNNLQKFFDKNPKEVNYVKNVNGLYVVFDVHYQIAIAGHVSTLPNHILQKEELLLTKDFLSSKKTITLSKTQFSILEPHRQILYLLLHFYQHKWSGIEHLDFISRVFNAIKKRINKKSIFILATDHKILSFILPSTYLLDKYFLSKALKRIAYKDFKRKYIFAITVYKAFNYESFLFSDEKNKYNDRLKKALLIFLFTNLHYSKKIFRFLHPALTSHFLYFTLYSTLTLLKKNKRTLRGWRNYM